ncbi:MAG: UDP-N-acetylmuramoyl-L-alanine--D-glutamate ligase [Ruminococcus sp.]|nr:UDP-N-acetylmuramoyl-L-alanine--D-glutamate ligase [Ruminococcus sp.]
MKQISRFFEEMQQKRVAFIGVGVTNTDIIRLFLKKGIRITLLDRKQPEQLGDIYNELKAAGVSFRLGEAYLENLTDFDVIFRSPGMYFHHPKLTEARENGVSVTTEMEVFFELCPCKIYAVTGSDGKTTTTTLISEFLQASGVTVHKGGNIGRALLPIIESIEETDAAVVELSSFQLLSMRQSPDVAVITNIAPNHLDVHGTMEEYIASKVNLIAHQNAFSKTILNLDNELTNALSPQVRGTLVKFSRNAVPERGSFLREDGMLCYTDQGEVTPVVHMDDIRLPGMHNVENYLTAISAVWGEVSADVIVHTAKTFGGVEHRIEFVRELDGVKWYNDSIATSPTRVLAGLRSFHQKLIVLMGGYDKMIPFEPMAETVCEKVKVMILMGATAPKIEAAVTGCAAYKEGCPVIVHASSMEEAVAKAQEIAEKGDVVTLSPACASFDLYPNFEARGNHYKRLVKELNEQV